MSSRQTPDGAIAGYWYLPATPQHRVGGRLYVQTDGTTVLEVAEKLDASQGPRVQSRFERVIHGRGTDGTLYSLFNNNLRNEGHSRPPDDRSKAVPNMAEYSYYVWHVSTYAVGKDLVDADSSLAAIQLSFSVLREWMSEEAVLESVWGDAKEDRLTIPWRSQVRVCCRWSNHRAARQLRGIRGLDTSRASSTPHFSRSLTPRADSTRLFPIGCCHFSGW